MVPGSAWIMPGWCGPTGSSAPVTSIPDKNLPFNQLVDQQLGMSSVMELTIADDTSLAQSISKTSSALEDLMTLIESSDLPSREDLLVPLRGIEKDGEEAADLLSTLSASVGGAVTT